MSGLREQVIESAAGGRILETATAIVGAERQRGGFRWLEKGRAKWAPQWQGTFPEPIGFPDIRLGTQPVGNLGVHRSIAMLCSIKLEVGTDRERFGVKPEFEEELGSDAWALAVLQKFAHVYCSAGYTEGLPRTEIIERSDLVELRVPDMPAPEMCVVDHRTWSRD